MSSDYQQKKMMNALGAIDPKGNIVIEQFEDATALLFQPGNVQPFCVAENYNRATGEWSSGTYFGSVADAHDRANPEIIEGATVKWEKEDIREKLENNGIEPSEENVQIVIDGDPGLWLKPMNDMFNFDFRGSMIADGNDSLADRVHLLKEEEKFITSDTAVPATDLDEMENHPIGLAEKSSAAKAALDAQYEPDEQGRVFDRPCEVLSAGNNGER